MLAHQDYWLPHVNAGLVVAMGPVADPKGAYGVMIVNAPSLKMLEDWQAQDPVIARRVRISRSRIIRCRRSASRLSSRWRRSPPFHPRSRRAPSRGANDMATEIRVPTLGESISEATVGKWFKKPGDAVKADEPLVELETEKVTLEVNAPSRRRARPRSSPIRRRPSPIGALLGSLERVAAPAQAAAPKPPRKPAPSKRRRRRSRRLRRPSRAGVACRPRLPPPRWRPRTASTSAPSPAAASAARC